jgi:hypothetical protein
MKKKSDQASPPGPRPGHPENTDPQGYPLYPADEDIYSRSREERDLDPEDLSRHKAYNEDDIDGINNEKDFDDDMVGDDLDVPGSELDDEQEDIGNEDEENNYYSLGGDRHNDLDEDRGE